MRRVTILAAVVAAMAAAPAMAEPSDNASERAHQTHAAAGTMPGDGSDSAVTVGSGAATEDSGTVGTVGSAAVGGTSASTLGLGATSTGQDGETASALGTGGSAAAADGKIHNRSHVVENPNMIQGRSRAQAMDQGTFSRSHTKTRVRHGEELDSRTKSMSHVPGEKPEMSTTTEQVEIQ
jgi:hypothetical protein